MALRKKTPKDDRMDERDEKSKELEEMKLTWKALKLAGWMMAGFIAFIASVLSILKTAQELWGN